MSRRASVPVIDISALVSGIGDSHEAAARIESACRDWGFFQIIGHGVDERLQDRLEHVSRQFFAQDLETKLEIRMARGGRAWRGYFPVGGELTSGEPDLKEGIYFGEELGDHGVPLHGPNLFPREIPELREAVLDYMKAMTALGHVLIKHISLSLGLDASYFADHYTSDPLVLFRIFNYPPAPHVDAGTPFGVGEHTDYGLLTILRQDTHGGLQVKVRSEWVDADP